MFLTARRLFDARTAEVRHDWVIEIHGGQIVAVGPRSPDAADPDVIDLGDATLMPGLVDVHQHLCFDASDDPVGQLEADDDASLLLRMRLAAQRALAVGITTVRDLGDRSYLSLTLRDWFAAGNEVGPRILCAGPPITVPQGHCWFLGGEAEGAEAVRAAVRERVARGVDVVKMMASGGNLTPTVGPHESQYGVPELTAALDETHKHGLKLAVHAHGAQAVADAIAVGVDSIEHCTFFTADGVDASPEVLARIAASGTAVSMTAAVVPGDGSSAPAAIQLRLAAITENMATLHGLGTRLVCSSDAGVGPTKPHDVLPHGISYALPRLGMSNAEALISSTALAADVCGVGDVTGTLEAGKDADVLAVAGDPLGDLAAIHDVVAVFARGQRVALSGREPPGLASRP